MNYTTNYHLPQWVESDRILMEDFNEAMSDIDGGITAAQAAADSAYSAANKPYVIGRYTGNGPSNSQTITLGFRPSLLILIGDYKAETPSAYGGLLHSTFGIVTAGHGYDTVALTDTGFTVQKLNQSYPVFNSGGDDYAYIAFR